MSSIDMFTFNHKHYSVETVHSDSDEFSDVLAIRSQGKEGVFTDPYDATADIYLLIEESNPLATMRVNQARRGEMDCEQYYPPDLLDQFRNVIGSGSRLARCNVSKPNVHVVRKMILSVWAHQVADGMRMDVINVHQNMIPYYSSIGYRLLCNSFFFSSAAEYAQSRHVVNCVEKL